jgi:hypothetical protein
MTSYPWLGESASGSGLRLLTGVCLEVRRAVRADLTASRSSLRDDRGIAERWRGLWKAWTVRTTMPYPTVSVEVIGHLQLSPERGRQ